MLNTSTGSGIPDDPSKVTGGRDETVTVLVPVYNEADGLERFFSSFDSVFLGFGYLLRFLAVNDGSLDNTLQKLLEIKHRGGVRLKIVSLTRNFGRHAAVFAGLANLGNTDYVVVADADLQNPPLFAPKMIAYLKEAHLDLVYGLRPNPESAGFFSIIFWILAHLLSGFKIPRNQTSLVVFNRSFLENLRKLNRRPSFFPAALAGVNGRVGYFAVETVPRVFGRSKYNLVRKIRLFLKSVRDLTLKKGAGSLYRIDHVYE